MSDDLLSKHFLITENSKATEPLVREEVVCGRRVFIGKHLRFYPLIGDNGETRGALLGWILSEDGLLADGAPLVYSGEHPSFEAWSAKLCGRFVAIVDDGKGPYMVLDAGGLLGCIYCSKSRVVASIPSQIPNAKQDADLLETFNIPSAFGWYPFGLTPMKGVRRLLPNFKLDLTTFETERVWPHQQVPESGTKTALKLISDLVSENAVNLARRGNVTAHLTAGYDSRMLLAACWPIRDEIRFVTIVGIPGTTSDLDSFTAGHLAKIHNLAHENRAFMTPKTEEISEWRERTGFCINDHVASLTSTLRRWNPDEVQLAGVSGEVGRSFYWGASDIGESRPDAQTLSYRLSLPRTGRVIEAAEDWLSSLGDYSTPFIWDLAYIEQRLGCWAGSAVYGSSQPVPSLTPFNSRAIYSALLSLPEPVRARNEFPKGFIETINPELNQTPYNRPFGLRALREPKQLLKGLLPHELKERLKRFARQK